MCKVLQVNVSMNELSHMQEVVHRQYMSIASGRNWEITDSREFSVTKIVSKQSRIVNNLSTSLSSLVSLGSGCKLLRVHNVLEYQS